MKFFKANEWKLVAFSAAFVLPLIVIVVFAFVDLIEYFEKSN
jgi:hypothetical protein